MKDKYRELYDRKDNPGDALERLRSIISVLRKECPWDKVQTHESLTRCMIEEAYEAADAIKNKDLENLREELGDVLLQVVFHGGISEEDGEFSLSDVINDECDKMIRRHPHIFSDEKIKTIDKVLEKWENVKSKEHGESSYTARLDRVTQSLPALIRNSKVQKKVSEVNSEFFNVTAMPEKIDIQMEAFIEACQKGEKPEISEILGDLLSTIVCISESCGVDPEDALNDSTDRFIEVFRSAEEQAAEEGRNICDLTADEIGRLLVTHNGKQ